MRDGQPAPGERVILRRDIGKAVLGQGHGDEFAWRSPMQGRHFKTPDGAVDPAVSQCVEHGRHRGFGNDDSRRGRAGAQARQRGREDVD
jgi:hypothetical protein